MPRIAPLKERLSFYKTYCLQPEYPTPLGIEKDQRFHLYNLFVVSDNDKFSSAAGEVSLYFADKVHLRVPICTAINRYLAFVGLRNLAELDDESKRSVLENLRPIPILPIQIPENMNPFLLTTGTSKTYTIEIAGILARDVY